MIRTVLVSASLIFFAGAVAAAELSADGTDLGRVKASDLTAGLTVTADVGDTAPVSSFIIARFPDNRPLMKGADGLWEPWDGDPATLVEAGVAAADGVMTFAVTTEQLSDVAFPVVFTVGYQTAAGPKSGFIAVDEP